MNTGPGPKTWPRRKHDCRQFRSERGWRMPEVVLDELFEDDELFNDEDELFVDEL